MLTTDQPSRLMHGNCHERILASLTAHGKRECQSDIIRVGFLACQIYRAFSVFHFLEPPAASRRRWFVMCTSLICAGQKSPKDWRAARSRGTINLDRVDVA